ncbi:hypothetical protein PSI23_11180 [Xenorhabdus sp. XENO-10]|uniref:Uncharacterized protein n=1 Tax=Xenorhabdus yunnanensis TaxID=3025878 RepID=A0ABT5LH81_9GAMM|nr:hypothetical protein [Xenorhabdus yunnanensis]MDC9589846.1 hypothetical protein [Xenorhabdus yunnanensis]
MSYPNGTIIKSAQNFPRYTTFGDGCIFASGCSFSNPCYFGKGCIFQKGCALHFVPDKQPHPPHQTGEGNVFAENCTLMYVIVGVANVIRNPITYQPISQGAGTIVGDGNNDNHSCQISSTIPYTKGQVISDCHVSQNWKQASQPDGFTHDTAKVKDTSWGIK